MYVKPILIYTFLQKASAKIQREDTTRNMKWTSNCDQWIYDDEVREYKRKAAYNDTSPYTFGKERFGTGVR